MKKIFAFILLLLPLLWCVGAYAQSTPDPTEGAQQIDIKISWDAPTKLESGADLDPALIDSYELWVNGRNMPNVAGELTSFEMPTSETSFEIVMVTVLKDGRKSKPTKTLIIDLSAPTSPSNLNYRIIRVQQTLAPT